MELNNLTSFSFDEDKLCGVAEFVFEKEGVEGSLSLALLGKEEMRELNRIYRGKDRATDVLSFPFDDEVSDLRGEVVICPEEVEYGEEGMIRAIIHGTLHILGYDHEKEEDRRVMEEKEKLYFSSVEDYFLKR